MQLKPREKIAKYGPKHLESWELIALLLGTGSKGIDVFQVARKAAKVIEKKQDHLILDDLLSIASIGPVKATQIIAGFELARRHYIHDDISLQSVSDVLFQVEKYRNKKQEYLIALTLDGAKKMIRNRVVTIGLLDESLAHPREIFSDAISDRAHSIILVHNHPSGDPSPSHADIRMTQRVKEVGQLIGISLQDHIILGKKNYFSFKEENIL
ncbi:DNA repair protein RadC [Candidatus Gracilibacteria bacterium]|nr:DNA repair protein RadC [Candidatus Gracilibacteria bacterium]